MISMYIFPLIDLRAGSVRRANSQTADTGAVEWYPQRQEITCSEHTTRRRETHGRARFHTDSTLGC